MKTAAVYAVIVASALALPLEDPQQWLGLKEFRQAPGYYGLPNYGTATLPHSGASASYGAEAAGSGAAYGMFPNAKVGGCNVPLLISCSPNVVHGKLLPSYSPPSYKDADDLLMNELEWMNHMRDANQHLLMGEHPQPNTKFAPVAHKHSTSNTPEKPTQN